MFRGARFAFALRERRAAPTGGAYHEDLPSLADARVEQGERRLDVVEFLEMARALKTDPSRLLAEIDRR